MQIKKGDIVLANLEPIRGREQGGIRPVLIIQNDISNKYSPVAIVVAITSKISREYPTNVFLSKKDSALEKDSTVLLNQIRTIDKQRLIKYISSLDAELMKRVDIALKISLSLD